MPETRLARAREGYEDYVYQPPQGRRIKNPHAVTVGCWYSYCCELDLFQIETEAGRQCAFEDLLDEDIHLSIWHTREDALSDLIP